MISPERKPFVVEHKEEFEVSESLKDSGVEVIETAYKATVKDGRGRNLTQSSANQPVIIQIPADKVTLTSWSKGSVVNSVTWLATFWLRAIKRTLHFGWRLVVKSKS